MIAKSINTPQPSGRKVFGTINKKAVTPVVNTQERKLLKPQVGIAHNMSVYLICHLTDVRLYTLTLFLFLRDLKSHLRL